MHFVDTMHSEADVTFTYIVHLHSDAYDTVHIITHSYAYIGACIHMHSNAFLCIHVLVDQDPHSSLASLVVFCPRGAAHLLLGHGGDGFVASGPCAHQGRRVLRSLPHAMM